MELKQMRTKKKFGYEKSLSESTNKQVFCVNSEIENKNGIE